MLTPGDTILYIVSSEAIGSLSPKPTSFLVLTLKIFFHSVLTSICLFLLHYVSVKRELNQGSNSSSSNEQEEGICHTEKGETDGDNAPANKFRLKADLFDIPFICFYMMVAHATAKVTPFT